MGETRPLRFACSTNRCIGSKPIIWTFWQIHGVCFDNDPDLFIRKGGAAEALEQAKKEWKVRFVGFTGHKDRSTLCRCR